MTWTGRRSVPLPTIAAALLLTVTSGCSATTPSPEGDVPSSASASASDPSRASTEAERSVTTTAQPVDLPDGPRLVFRTTTIGDDYGKVAVVPLSRPRSRPVISGVDCERIDATATGASCLHGVAAEGNTVEWLDLDAGLGVTGGVVRTGIPSRTRMSDDGRLTASTLFVTKHEYMQDGFATATEIRNSDGTSHGNLEDFQLVLDGEEVEPDDRNVWGVSFIDDTRFYATVGTGGVDYLVEGDLESRTLTATREGVECPALSPDGRHLAYKVDRPTTPVTWSIAVLDLGTGIETVLAGEVANVDDQVEWLDGDTLLYGLARADEPGVTDIWSLKIRPNAKPQLFRPEAWSPSVVRPTG